MDTIKAVVQKVVPKGRHGPFVVATSDQVDGSVTVSLEPTVWEEKEWPENGMIVFLGKLRKKRAGWRAKQGRFWKPSDEQTERSKEMNRSGPTNDEFLADLDQVLQVLEAGPDRGSFARGRFVACYLKVSASVEGMVSAVLSLVPYDGYWASVQGVQFEITPADGSKRLVRSGLAPGVAIDKLPAGSVRVALGPCSLPQARREVNH